MKIFLKFQMILILFMFGKIYSQKLNDTSFVMWELNNTKNIGGFSTLILGNPKIIEDKESKAIWFDGIDDGIIVKGNPLDNFDEFTIEIIFKPDSNSNPENVEQRFFHIQNPENSDRRILIELRIAGKNEWFLDTFIKSDTSDCPLYSENFLHKTDEFYHAALTYKNGVMTHYVNGEKELSGNVQFLPIKEGNISLGTRMDKRSWFKGSIKKIKFTSKSLEPKNFMKDMQ